MPSSSSGRPAGLDWQIGVWDEIASIYVHEIERRFAPVVDAVVRRAAPRPGERVLDIGTGTGAAAVRCAAAVGPAGHSCGVDISGEMLTRARQLASTVGLSNAAFLEGRAEALPFRAGVCQIVLASLSLMYVIDRAAAAREIARVLEPRGRFVAAVWAGPDACDIVWFQQTAGRFAPAPPVAQVGPGALADPTEFVDALERAGIRTSVETETLGFDFDDFESAWDVLAGVTAAQLPAARRDEAKAAVRRAMWPVGDGPRHFRNVTQFIVGARA
jgi:SAM-dependent methyltransferase